MKWDFFKQLRSTNTCFSEVNGQIKYTEIKEVITFTLEILQDVTEMIELGVML